MSDILIDPLLCNLFLKRIIVKSLVYKLQIDSKCSQKKKGFTKNRKFLVSSKSRLIQILSAQGLLEIKLPKFHAQYYFLLCVQCSGNIKDLMILSDR